MSSVRLQDAVESCVVERCVFDQKAQLVTNMSMDVGGTSVFVVHTDFRNGGGIDGGYATCNMHKDRPFPTSNACGGSAACTNSSMSVRCLCPGHGNAEWSPLLAAEGLLRQFSCVCTPGSAGLDCVDGVINLKQVPLLPLKPLSEPACFLSGLLQ